jgi:hypothetical protein
MPYDEQGNFYGSNEDLGDLEAKYVKPNPASQIPGQVSSSKPEESKSLREKAVAALMQYNPLMVMKSLKEASGAVALGGVLPVAAPLSAGVQALNAAPGNAYRRSLGEKEVETPSANELMQKYGEAIYPKTQLGQDMVGGVSKLMDTLKVPAAWPMVPNAPRRPMLTPTDVRVGAGQVRQLAKELRETPADFQAAQSGLKRQNLYGEDTLGVKAQAAADALGDTLEQRKSAGKSLIPGLPEALTPETKLYAVRPKGSRIVQAKLPATAKGYNPDNNLIGDMVEDIYDDVPSGEMPPALILQKYSRKYLSENDRFRELLRESERQKAREMFPDAPSSGDAQRAYDVLYSNQSKRNEMQLQTIEDVLNSPEGARYREQGVPTPKEFMTRMSEAERILKGPFTNFITKNVGAEGDPMVSLARQGITYESPEKINNLAQFANSSTLAERRLAGGFPAMGSFVEERLAKTGELDRLNEEIQNIEAIREPLFNRAHEEGIDPASIPEYAEATNPLRLKLREREKLQGDLENIKLATSMENLGDTVVAPKTKQQMLKDIPYEQRQFFPSVTKAADDEKLFAATTKSLLNDMGYKKLGEDLLNDILEGKAGDTSKLTIENFIRDKHMSRVEAEKAAKLQQQQYRAALETSLTERLKNDQNVQTFGNAAIITLDKNTPKDVAIRDMSVDTSILDHCVGQCGTAPKGRKNVLTGQQQYYEPIVDPITGKPGKNSPDQASTIYINDLQRGDELVSVRDAKTGLPAATIQLTPAGQGQNDTGQFNIGYASGAKNGAVDPAYVGAIKDYLNSRASVINSSGTNLVDNTGIFDTTVPGEWRRVTKAAGLSKDQAAAFEAETDTPRFITVDDVKEMSKKYSAMEPSASRELTTSRPSEGDRMPDDLDVMDLLRLHGDRMSNEQTRWLERFARRWEEGVDESQTGQRIEREMTAEYDDWLANNRLQPPPTEDLGLGDWEVDNAHGANNQGFVAGTVANDLFYTDVAVDGTANTSAIEDTIFGLRNGQIDHQAFRDLPEQTRQAGMNLVADIMQAMIHLPEERYNIPPATVQEIQARFASPGITVDTLMRMRGYAQRGEDGSIFANLSQASRDGAARMITDEINRRGQAPDQPAQPAQPGQVAVRAQVPREIQTLSMQDLVNGLSPSRNRQAQELANQYFDENIIDGDNTTIGALTDMIRSYAIGPHAESPFEVRELAARRLESLNTGAQQDADQIAETLRDAMYDDMTPEEAMRQADRDVSTLLRHGEAAWEDLIGPLAEDIPWSRNLQARLIENLRIIADQFREMRDEGHAKGGLIKKNRKANKARTPSVVNMRYPELAEMQYRYGGMV